MLKLECNKEVQEKGNTWSWILKFSRTEHEDWWGCLASQQPRRAFIMDAT